MVGSAVRWASLGLLLGTTAAAKVEIKPMEHDIQGITQSNFDGVIGKFRENSVSSLWFYNADSKEDLDFLPKYNEVAKSCKGMAKVTAISCTDWPAFCKKQGVTATPAVMLYPPNPVPAFLYAGKMESKSLSGQILKWIPDLSTRLTKENIDAWITTDPSKPKVMLFSNKPKVPTMWRALSSETVFRRTAKFGFITQEDKELCARFKVTKFPQVILKPDVKKQEVYKGELNFGALQTFVNLHSESGMGDKVSSPGGGSEESMEEAKPWLVQDVPELTAKSHNDVCFKGEGLCVIYLTDNHITPEETEMLTGLSKKFTSQLSDRGAKMKWMWMNLGVEAAYKKLFDPPVMPSAVVFNPHKRLRFTKMDHGEDNEFKGNADTLTKLMDKVLGGDARFKMVPGQKLPGWAAREKPSGKKTEL